MSKEGEMSPEHPKEITLHGVFGWYHHMIEKWGWIVICAENGNKHKLLYYVKSLNKLKQAIDAKKGEDLPGFKKNDLGIMSKNVDTLLKHIERDFKIDATKLQSLEDCIKPTKQECASKAGLALAGGARRRSRRSRRSRKAPSKKAPRKSRRSRRSKRAH